MSGERKFNPYGGDGRTVVSNPRLQPILDKMLAGEWSFDMSHTRARMAVMRQDPINAALWSLAGFDTALVHFAELSETLQKRYPADHDMRVAFDRALSVYLESQYDTLQQASFMDKKEFDAAVEERIGHKRTTQTGGYAVALTDDPLILEIFGYALRLAILTAHGEAPWRRFEMVMAECFDAKHPDAFKTGKAWTPTIVK